MRMDDVNHDEMDPQGNNAETSEDMEAAFVSDTPKGPSKGALGVLALLVAFGGVVYFMYFRNGPQLANAASQEQVAAKSTIDDFLQNGGGSAKLMQQTLKDTEKVVQEFQASSVKNQVPLEKLGGNPFQLKLPEEKKEDDTAARLREQMAAEKARIAHDAAGLEIQSVMRGTHSAVMINNAMYHVGEKVGDFMVDEIRARSVVVSQKDYKFELTMKR